MNILNILLDDFGLEQFTRFGRGSNYPSMPFTNSLYDGGVRFTKYYGQQLCSPQRATMLAGLHPFHHGVGDLVRGPLSTDYSALRTGLTFPTVATFIRKATTGIRTAAFGKWHLSTEWGGGLLGPNNAGFEHFSGHLFNLQTGQETYYSWDKDTNGKVIREDEYLPAVLIREAINWINERGKEQWVLHLAPFSCHTPLQVTGIPPTGTFNPAWNTATESGVFKACIEAIDFYLAMLPTKIPASIWNNTLVILSTDNGSGSSLVSLETDPVTGTAYPAAVVDPYSLKDTDHTAFAGGRGKDSPFDTGVHLPLIFYSAGGLLASPNRTVSNICQGADITPTILDLLGITPDVELDGRSLKPYLDNTSSAAIHPFVYSEHFLQNNASADADRIENQWMAYDGQYVLLYSEPLGYSGSMHFYDLNADPHQLTNLTPNGSTSGLSAAQRTARSALVAGRAALVAT